ncbi:hypothetical protein [Streptomyces triticiradicis]|uniref:Uncharacterized protein n=1 Tax=Streptomyces triticiradicis TaxID=2651189 RepID=A0A7J5DB88_9ACTN|nr:hypothetical protein [Streptomyces triticiradicis]KAB1986050.1 hypothetical protein F8144_24810 [Streptomyces triticiradicis]
MEILTTCLVSLAAVNIVLGLATRQWRRSVEARMVRQVRAWPGLDAYHADLLSTSEPLCSTDHQPGRLALNSFRAAAVAVRLMSEDGLLDRHGMKPAETAAEPAHPVTAAAFRFLSRYRTVRDPPRVGDIGRDPDFQAAVRAHLNDLFAHAPATRRHLGTTINDLALWCYGLGAAAPAVHAFFMALRTDPGDPYIRQGSFVLASLVFVAALIVLTAQAGNTWHPLEGLETPTALKELAPPREDPVDLAEGSGEIPGDGVGETPGADAGETSTDDGGETSADHGGETPAGE